MPRYRESVKALLIHGLSSNSTTWWRIRAALEEAGWEVTAPDLRGHGTSGPADSYRLEDYAGDLPDGPWDLVIGHSLGGAVAVLRGHTTRRLILLDPVIEVDPAEAAEIRDDQVAELAITLDSIRAAKPHWDARDHELKVEAVRQADPAAPGRSFDDNPTWNVVPQLRAIAVPTLILGGDHAVYSMLATATAESLAAANPLIEYRVVAGAGHSPHRDKPAETIAAVLSFLPAAVD